MSSRKEIIDDIINSTQILVEKSIRQELSNQIVGEIEDLLKDYLKDLETYEDQLFNAGCWGGGVWDRLYQYHDEYKPILILNYREIENNGCISPVMAEFPHKELNKLCSNGLNKIRGFSK